MKRIKTEDVERRFRGHAFDGLGNAGRSVRAGATQLYVVTAAEPLRLSGLAFRAMQGGGILRSIAVLTRCERNLGIEVTSESAYWQFERPMIAPTSSSLTVEIENTMGCALVMAELVWWGDRIPTTDDYSRGLR